MMRITQIMLSKGRGGAERIFVDLIKGLSEQGVQVQAIMDERFPQRDELEAIENVFPCYVRPVSHWDPFTVSLLYRRVKKFKPNLLHCHLSRAALMGGKVATKLSLPAVVTTHNNIKLKYCSRIRYFLVLTEAQREYLTSNGVAAEAISKIPNFSNLSPVSKVSPKNVPVFVSYGRMVPKKGFDDLLQAFRQVLEKEPNARLLVGGDGKEKARLLQRVAKLDLESRVSFVGWVEEVKPFLAQGAVFVLPSRDEPFGIVLLEVMASGVPVVTTRTGGACEILSEETAYFARVADPQSLAQAMMQALNGSDRVERAAAALALFNKRYRQTSVLPLIIEYYHQLLSGF